MRGSQMARQWRLIRLIESRTQGISAAELARELDVPIRTVYRDLQAIQDGGFPLYSEREGANSTWKLLDTFKKHFPLPLTPTELMALHVSCDMLSALDGSFIHESISSVLKKVKSCLTPETLKYLDEVTGKLTVNFGPARTFPGLKETIKTVSEATTKGQRIEIVYRAASTSKVTQRKVDPYHVHMSKGGFYLIGYCHVRREIRTFAMERVQDCRLLDESFEMRHDFDLQDYLRNAFQLMTGQPRKITVRISSSAAHIVRERMWHPSQEIQELLDGGVEITLRVPINYEIVSWILGFGPAAEVLQPSDLRNRIAYDLELAARQYGDAFGLTTAESRRVSGELS